MSASTPVRRSVRLTPAAELPQGATAGTYTQYPAVRATSTAPARTASATAERLHVSLIVLWVAVILAGVVLHQGSAVHESHGEVQELKRMLPLSPYDLLFRRTGALLFIVPYLLRLGSQLKSGKLASEGQRHFIIVLVSYLALAAYRTALYLVHYHGSSYWHNTAKPPDYLADHVVLGASLAATLSAEIVFAARGIDAAQHFPPSAVRLQQAAQASAGVLYLLTAGDMFFTAVYFHPRLEVLLAMVLGLASFQLPIYLALFHRERVPLRWQPRIEAFNGI